MDRNFETRRIDMRTLIDDAQQLFHDAGSATGQTADELRTRGMALLDKAASTARRAQDAALESGREIAASADDLVRHNLWTAIAVSAAAGILVGYLIARR